MIPHLTLVLGGARSGKSAWAERAAAESGQPVLYLATAVAGDAEMAARIQAHQAARPAFWRTVDAPLDLPDAIRRHARPDDLVLVDCLTLWVSNLILDRLGARDPDALAPLEWAEVEAAVLAAAGELLAALRDLAVPAILVSNEVGLGLVPPYPLGRSYRDALGRVNQLAAAESATVILMIAGLPVDLRRFTSG